MGNVATPEASLTTTLPDLLSNDDDDDDDDDGTFWMHETGSKVFSLANNRR